MTPEQRFQEAKAASFEAHRSLSKCVAVAEYNRRVQLAHDKEAEAFRAMITTDDQSPHPMQLVKFSWEE